MSKLEDSRSFMNQLAEAGLPIPETATYVGISCNLDSVPILLVESILTKEQAEHLVKFFEFRDITQKPEGKP